MSMRWATVTAVSPLRIQLDGDTDALPYTPDSLVDPAALAVDDRVRCELSDRRVVILGRSQGVVVETLPVGTHLSGEWATAPDGYVLADGAVLNIADWPLLAAHYEDVYGTVNHHGGNGTTTFATPDTRERVYVNQGGADIFATIGAVTGAKTHAHTLTQAIAAVWVGFWKVRGGSTWTATNSGGVTAPGGSSSSTGNGAAIEGSTDDGSTVQPSFVCRFVIRAA